jgi:cellulose synthase/poly-beta-1,6-N-acetylglucosamine synthase-like glycosyltransferase/peptidoglycan/xylan/chitin deacetylase (PgdA/CDA1 family)/spore germination protein YaaH
MQSQPVFFDPRGRRRAVLPRLTAAFAVVAVGLILTFVATLYAVPSLGQPRAPRHRYAYDGHAAISVATTRRSRRDLYDEIARGKTGAAPIVRASGQVVAAFYAPWQESGLNSLEAYGRHLTHLIPAWLHLTADGDGLDLDDFNLKLNPSNASAISIARKNGVRIMPLLSNYRRDRFDRDLTARLLSSPERQQRLASRVKDWLLDQRFQGLNVDFENLTDAQEAQMPGFLTILGGELRTAGLELTVSTDSATDPEVLAKIAGPVDWVVLMDYDEHAETTPPGPIASLGWAREVLDKSLKSVPREKLVLGIGSYAYDWAPGKRGEPLTFQEALTLAADYRENEPPDKVIDFDADLLNSTFQYKDDDGALHEVWMLDEASAYNQWLGARNRGLRGAGVWALGMEDPGIWRFLDRSTLEEPLAIKPEQRISFPYGVDYVGKGEILKVVEHPTQGTRKFEVDADTGLVTDMNYVRYPFPYVIQHSGYRKGELALTFDDGPDAQYTGQVLDELKKLGVKATFFLVGNNVEQHPELVKRIYDEGHEIGNHTFFHPDLSDASRRRIELELNATQRAIQSVTGHSTILFRPPFNADSEPQAPADVRPVNIADSLGYITVGEKIDPQDWNPTIAEPDGTLRARTADDIAQEVISGVHEDVAKGDEGNIILLHDAGGRRDATIAALRMIVPQLQREGFRFVTTSDLMGKTRAEVMPALTAKDRFAIWFDGCILSSVFAGESFLATGFLVAIVLGVARVFLVAPLALLHGRRQRKAAYDPAYRPKVAALIAAYNEEGVIRRTVESVLSSTYGISEVVVVDDGSTDKTSQVVASLSDPRVRLQAQENGGKASALNHALRMTDAEIVVCIDADTQLDPEAIGKLVRHFQDPQIAAVAGNVRVGNVNNVLTKWQAIEYTTSQNLDRRAYAVMNSITVVPGAIGAWRRDAVLAAGGYVGDTLAEDMDLTWRLREAGHRIENESAAHAYTEAPEAFRSFFKQRFRWGYGTLQCLVKHLRSLGRYGLFGRVALPLLWIFAVVFQVLAPLVDLQVVYSLFTWVVALGAPHTEAGVANLSGASATAVHVLALYALFFGIEFAGAVVGYRLDGVKPRGLGSIFLQRFAYRQLMYGVAYKSILRALAGGREGWGKLERKGSVRVSTS